MVQFLLKYIFAILILIFQLNIVLSQTNTTSLKILDCRSSEVLPDFFVYDAHHNLIAISDSLGQVSIKSNRVSKDSLTLIKLGYFEKKFSWNKMDSKVCLEYNLMNIDTVNIISNPIYPLDHLTEIMEWNATQWNPKNDSYIYDFTYSVSYPDSGWIEAFKGKIFLPIMQSNLHASWTALKYVVIDTYSIYSAFLESPIYTDMPGNRINQNINHLIIRDNKFKKTFKGPYSLEYNRNNHDQNVISFYSKYKKERSSAQIVDFNRETNCLIKREVWCSSCSFNINKWKSTDYKEVEIYRNEGVLFVGNYSLQDGFTKEGVVVYHRFEMNYYGKIKGDLNEMVVLPKVRMTSHNAYLTELMKDVNIHYDKSAFQKLLESSGIAK